MKKLGFFCAVLLFLFCFVHAAYGQTIYHGEEESFEELFAHTIIIKENAAFTLVNGQKAPKVNIITKNNRTLVPVRFVAENFSARVDWEQKTQTITISLNQKTVKLKQNSKEMWVEDKKTTMDTAATVVNGTTYIPLRAVGEGLDKTVEYNGNDQTIYIYEKNSVFPNFEVGSRVAKLLFAENQILYFDSTNIFYQKDGKTYLLSSYAPKGELLENQAGYIKRDGIDYLITNYSAAMSGNKAVYCFKKDGEIKPLMGGPIRSFVIDEHGDYIYMIESVWGEPVINPAVRREYQGNLTRINLRELANGRPATKEYLGLPGYVYGLLPTYQDANHPDPETGGYTLFDKAFTPVLRDGFLYLNGVAFLEDMSKAKSTYANYKIPITGRSHEKIGAADK